MDYEEIEDVRRLRRRRSLDLCVLQGLDLREERIAWSGKRITRRTVFLGCALAPRDEARLRSRGASFFPRFERVLPYDPYRARLYTSAELMEGYDGRRFATASDQAIHAEFGPAAKRRHVMDELAQRLHDHSVADALHDFLDRVGRKRVVGIMGGHGNDRRSREFLAVARLAHRLTRGGHLVVTGGGPGTMEAGNLGAFLAPHGENAVAEAVSMLKDAPAPGPRVSPAYLRAAQEVVRRFAPGLASAWGFTLRSGRAAAEAGQSLALPTWTYGHEPTNLFATHIAKYFQNSVREEGLVTLAEAGIVFAAGKAGTCQEIFTDAVQNYYAVRARDMKPMAFYPREYWTRFIPVLPCLRGLAQTGRSGFAARVRAFDTVAGIERFLRRPPAVRRRRR